MNFKRFLLLFTYLRFLKELLTVSRALADRKVSKLLANHFCFPEVVPEDWKFPFVVRPGYAFQLLFGVLFVQFLFQHLFLYLKKKKSESVIKLRVHQG